MMKVGDVCPQCKDGLLVRTEVGIECDECSFSLDLAELVEQNEKSKVTAGAYKYKRASIRIRIDNPELGEEFLRGLILARQNNNSPLFIELIDGINSVLEPYRAAKLAQEMSARSSAGMP
jgi:hypothetical protein